jgi:hypothetical protein
MAEDAKTTVLGLFRNQEEAERAIDRLVKGGVPASDVGLLAPGQADEPDFKKSAAAGVGGGAVLGAVAGGLLGVASMAVAPGIGPIVTAGAWLPPIIGLATGASAGGTAGGLLSMAGTDDEGLHYRQQVQAGRALVNVTTEKPDEVRALLHEAGALEVADMGQSASAAKLTESGDKPKADQT